MPDAHEPEKSEYRHVIAWEKRLIREGPFLASVFESCDPGKILDVGCGSGDHSRWFAERGWTAVGIDVAEPMINSAVDLAGETAAGGSARFELRDGAHSSQLAEAPFDGALFLGNGTAFIDDEQELNALLAGISKALAPGAPLLIQTLNYQRIESVPVRALPVNVRPLPEDEAGEGELVFIRVMSPKPDEGVVDFFPIGLELFPSADPENEPPEVRVRSAKQFSHRGWKAGSFETFLARQGFSHIEFYGGMQREPFDPKTSHDLVVLAKKA